MKLEGSLTTEKIKKKYPSQFELVNEMIDEARRVIQSGRPAFIQTKTDNVAVIVYFEFEQGKEALPIIDDIEVEEPIIV